ncbi:MAG: discoidin domain-containing protein [Candidatus Omnitrophica bacterium]|nr:discoidin domain-containing protein [Candidatus Omnitrophota bacterium]
MKKVFAFLIFTFFLLSLTYTVSANPGSAYIRYWVICGPFENADLDTECVENEADFHPIAGKFMDGKRCRRYLSCEDRIIFDLDEIFGPLDNVVAYAFLEVYSPTSRKVKLFLGSDDGVKVWLNGKNVFTNKDDRDFVFDEDKIDVELKFGWNRLLIKIYDKKGSWVLSARFVGWGGSSVKDLTYRPKMLYQLPVKRIEASSIEGVKLKDEGIFDLEDRGIFDAENAIDKSRWTRWSSRFSDPQWLILDLGKARLIRKILLNWESYAKSYSIEFSNDKINWKVGYSTDIGDGGQDVIGFKRPIRARYIKVIGTQRGTRLGYSLWELQVFSDSN